LINKVTLGFETEFYYTGLYRFSETYNEYFRIRQHYLFIKTQATCFDPTLGHPQACGRQVIGAVCVL